MTAKRKGAANNDFEPIQRLISDKKISKSEIVGLSAIDYPLFSFRYLSNASIKGCKDSDFLVGFILRLRDLSRLGWAEIRKSPRHKYGLEPIPVAKIIPKIADAEGIMTADVKKLHVFRANDDNRPFVGLQVGRIFYVLFVETKFGDIYCHGG